MTDASIALNRFGLGARPGEDAGSDPRKWLAAQIATFDPRPQAIASQVPSTQVAGALADFYERQRILRQENPKPKGPAAAPAKPAGAQPAMAEGSTMQDMQGAPAMQDGMTARPAGAQMQDMQAKPAGKKLYEGEDAAMIARREARREQQQYYVGMVSARALTAITSPTPFAERLVHFWANHFAVSADKLELVGLC